jgi:hypothetical protein
VVCRSWIAQLRRKAFRGTGEESRVLMREKMWWNGIAWSRAKAQVAREAAQRIEIAQKIPVPRTISVVKTMTE